MVKVYAFRLLAITLYGLLIPQEIEYADSLLLAMITAGYAGIELVACAAMLSLDRSGYVRWYWLLFAATLWLSSLWLTALAFSHIVLSDALILYYKPITYALEAVLLASLVMELRACSEQKPAF